MYCVRDATLNNVFISLMRGIFTTDCPPLPPARLSTVRYPYPQSDTFSRFSALASVDKGTMRFQHHALTTRLPRILFRCGTISKIQVLQPSRGSIGTLGFYHRRRERFLCKTTVHLTNIQDFQKLWLIRFFSFPASAFTHLKS